MSVTDIRIARSTLAELRGVLVRALSRENLSVTDKIAIRKSHSSNALKAENYYNNDSGGKG
jgi:plasmid stability protein